MIQRWLRRLRGEVRLEYAMRYRDVSGELHQDSFVYTVKPGDTIVFADVADFIMRVDVT